MGAGWLYYHKYPPKRKCRLCGRRHFLRRIAVMSNGADVWEGYCPVQHRRDSSLATSDGYET